MNEVVTGIVAPSEGKKIKLGGLPMKCALIFTTNRIIVAKLASFIVNLTPILGLVGDIIANLANKKPDELVKLSPDEILKSDKSNYFLSYSDIKKVQVMHGTLLEERWSIIISLHKDRYNYLLFTRENFIKFLGLVQSTMPNVEVVLPKK